MFDIIVNPISGGGKSMQTLAIVEEKLQQLNIKYNIHLSQYPTHATQIVQELNKQENTKLIVIGGDGTFNDVLCGISNFDTITLGLISSGTGNDYVKSCNLPTDPYLALDIILQNNVTYSDYIQLDNTRAINSAGCGLDVDVLNRYNAMPHIKGKKRYNIALIKTLLNLRFSKVKITKSNGEELFREVFIATVANGTYIGGGMPISPNSNAFDGYFDVVLINKIPKIKVPKILIKFLKGKHITEKCTEVIRDTNINIELLDNNLVEVDGEIKTRTNLNCKLVSGKLKIYSHPA